MKRIALTKREIELLFPIWDFQRKGQKYDPYEVVVLFEDGSVNALDSELSEIDPPFVAKTPSDRAWAKRIQEYVQKHSV